MFQAEQCLVYTKDTIERLAWTKTFISGIQILCSETTN